ncbi:Protein CBG16104 [Caenorhabditis briggsae]|uniref:Protein CBG16104 n=2 Tax=Caenorhabditis briggsae TaxID=6238 RepID=A8XN43_CAEBR|nr:Protein CBG16104 [Caenorhabditis briggsae]ULT80079.1 hypothetical protein L3Y34_010569 [Caenorhabditis briggsae]CAP34273.1 Protein CBG16104 [Caenorhabditis briggsae]
MDGRQRGSFPSDTPQPRANTRGSSSRRFSGTSSFGARWGSQILEEARQSRGTNSARVYVPHPSAPDLKGEDPVKRLFMATVIGNVYFNCTEYRASLKCEDVVTCLSNIFF